MLFDEAEDSDSDVLPTNVLFVPSIAPSDEVLMLREEMHRKGGSVPMIFSSVDDDGREVFDNPGAFKELTAALGWPPSIAEAAQWIMARRAEIAALYADRMAAGYDRVAADADARRKAERGIG